MLLEKGKGAEFKGKHLNDIDIDHTYISESDDEETFGDKNSYSAENKVESCTPTTSKSLKKIESNLIRFVLIDKLHVFV